MEIFVRRLRAMLATAGRRIVSRIVAGRPVHFAGANPDASLATARYNAALSRFGFPEIHYVYEPVAAAFYFAPASESGRDRAGRRFRRRHDRLFADPLRDPWWKTDGDADRPFRRRHRWRSLRFPHDRQHRLAGDRQRQLLQKLRQAAGGADFLLRPISAAGTSYRSSRPRANMPI